MSATREGRLRFLVATDVAARGIDISHLTHVINHDFPDTAEQYVHRTGRTGRAGRTGTAIAIVGPKDIGNLYLLRLTYKIRPIERQLPSAGELKTRAERDLLQLFLDAFAHRAAHADDLSLARRLLTHEDAEPIVAGLLRDHLGVRGGDAATEAAEARRARNPQAERAKAVEAAPVKADSLPPARPRKPEPSPIAASRGRVDRTTPRQREAASAPRDPVAREIESRASGAPRWEPAKEADDDQPILDHADDDNSRLPKITVSDTRVIGDGADEAFVQVFINVGTREGVRTPDLHKLLAVQGIAPEDTNGIRVRDRMTFIGVRKRLLDRTVSALSGQVIGGRTVIAELARGR